MYVLQVESETVAAEFKLSNATQRLLDLETDVRAAREKTLQASSIADATRRKTDYISEDTAQTKRVTECHQSVFFSSVDCRFLAYFDLKITERYLLTEYYAGRHDWFIPNQWV